MGRFLFCKGQIMEKRLRIYGVCLILLEAVLCAWILLSNARDANMVRARDDALQTAELLDESGALDILIQEGYQSTDSQQYLYLSVISPEGRLIYQNKETAHIGDSLKEKSDVERALRNGTGAGSDQIEGKNVDITSYRRKDGSILRVAYLPHEEQSYGSICFEPMFHVCGLMIALAAIWWKCVNSKREER